MTPNSAWSSGWRIPAPQGFRLPSGDGGPPAVWFVNDALPGVKVELGFSFSGELTEVCIQRDPEFEPLLTRRAFKDLPLPKLERDARERLKWASMELERGRSPGLRKAEDEARRNIDTWGAPYVPRPASIPAMVEAFEKKRHPGRHGRPHSEYLELVFAYAAAYEKGELSISVLADQFCLSASRLSSRIYEARQRGLLTPTVQGRVGGRATPKAIALAKSLNQRKD